MSAAPQRIVVTGATGFLGSRLLAALLDDADHRGAAIIANDLRLDGESERVRTVPGDLGDAAVRGALLEDGCDLLFHLGGMLGAAAEAEPAAAQRVNVESTMALLAAVKNAVRPPRVVFASSIAVFAPPFPPIVDDATRPNPAMVYGLHKAMVELVVEQMSARGEIDGLALRLPGIVARPGSDARLKSAFLSRVFEVFARGENLTLPVAAEGTTWLLSVPACVQALLHAARIPVARIGSRRAVTLPALNVRFDRLVAALHARYPESPTRIGYAPEPAVARQFGEYPALATAVADALGFRHDGDLDLLVARALTGLQAPAKGSAS